MESQNTAVVVITEQPTTTRSDKSKPKKLPKGAQIALRALAECIDECGKVPPASNHIPAQIKIATTDQWRQYAYRLGISTGEERARQKAFKTATEHLIGDQHVGCWNGQVWLPK
jgi:hypothetical protein